MVGAAISAVAAEDRGVNASIREIICEEILVIIYEFGVGCPERREERRPHFVYDSHVFWRIDFALIQRTDWELPGGIESEEDAFRDVNETAGATCKERNGVCDFFLSVFAGIFRPWQKSAAAAWESVTTSISSRNSFAEMPATLFLTSFDIVPKILRILILFSLSKSASEMLSTQRRVLTLRTDLIDHK